MQLNTYCKAIVIALTLGALTACSANHSGTSASGSQTAGTANGVNGQNGDGQTGVQVGAADQVLTPQEQQQKQLAELRQNQTIYFDFDKTTIKSQFIKLLEEHAAFLRNHPSIHVLIEGNTDERGTPAYNIALGERRAKAVAQYLESLGVSSDQISTISYGEEKPVDNTHTAAGMAKNRRAVLVY
ncbi:peptidoglycan-associated lipoprotein Pal [Celerinatantimonas yamalensis]|uniref:Peptidoglycan-associated protein n=1 Tax=Celerinatantimonas yamalensis TaxID=559956 RepID=A0ABW9G6E0_9GAMM